MEIQKSQFRHSRVVEFSETDMAGIVHFSVFFKWMEAAEHAFLKYLDEPLILKNQHIWHGWPRVRASCSYKSPLRFQDCLDIEVKVTEILPRGLRYEFLFFKKTPLGEEKVAKGELATLFARFDTIEDSLEAVSIQDSLRKKLQSLSAVQLTT